MWELSERRRSLKLRSGGVHQRGRVDRGEERAGKCEESQVSMTEGIQEETVMGQVR